MIGVICYIIIPFFRDIATALDWESTATLLDTGWIRVTLALALLWTFVGINMRGLKFYERTLIPLMLLMFGLGAIVIFAGFSFNHTDFATALQAKEGRSIPTVTIAEFDFSIFSSSSSSLIFQFLLALIQ